VTVEALVESMVVSVSVGYSVVTVPWITTGITTRYFVVPVNVLVVVEVRSVHTVVIVV